MPSHGLSGCGTPTNLPGRNGTTAAPLRVEPTCTARWSSSLGYMTKLLFVLPGSHAKVNMKALALQVVWRWSENWVGGLLLYRFSNALFFFQRSFLSSWVAAQFASSSCLSFFSKTSSEAGMLLFWCALLCENCQGALLALWVASRNVFFVWEWRIVMKWNSD